MRTCCPWPGPSWACATRLSPEAERALLDHAWSGNVRELQNCMRRAVLLAEGEVVGPQALGLPPARPASARDAAPEPSRADIESVLARHDGVIAAAAQELGLSRQALYRRMEKFGIDKRLIFRACARRLHCAA